MSDILNTDRTAVDIESALSALPHSRAVLDFVSAGLERSIAASNANLTYIETPEEAVAECGHKMSTLELHARFKTNNEERRVGIVMALLTNENFLNSIINEAHGYEGGGFVDEYGDEVGMRHPLESSGFLGDGTAVLEA